MSVGGNSQPGGYKYFLGVHMGLCHGPVDAITKIEVDNRVAWEGVNEGGPIDVDAPELFGGERREGGVSGRVDIEMGLPSQGVNSYLSTVLDASPPAFRGVTCAVLNQCYMGNNPYLKNWAFQVSRIHVRQDGIEQWYDARSEIQRPGTQFDAEGCFVYDCEAFRDFVIPAVWSYALFAEDKPSGLGLYEDETGKGNDWMLASGGSLGRGFLPYDPATTPLDCDISYLQEQISGGAIHNVYPSLTDEYEGGFIAVGAIMRQDSTAGADEITVLSLWRNIPSQEYVRIWWNRAANTMGIQSSDPLDGGVKKTTFGFAPPPTNTWFFVEVSATFTSKSAAFRMVYVDGDGEVVTRTASEAIRVNLATLPWANGIRATIANDVVSTDYDWQYSIRSAWVRDGAGTLSSDLSDNFIVSNPAYVLPEECRARCADMNPAHIIRECLTDPDWGLGYLDADVDDTSFIAAADRLFVERMGISLIWDREVALEDFISEILRHIDATLYVSRETGKFVLKLIRDDYIVNSLVVLNQDNVSDITDAKRPTVGELVNAVTVNYWDSEVDEDASLTLHNQALRTIQGVEVSTTRQYPGFTNRDVASRVAVRDLKVLSTPLLQAKITANRDAAVLNRGDAFVLEWPEHNIESIVMRVQTIEYGDGRDNSVQIEAIEDSFSVPNLSPVSQSNDVGFQNPTSAQPSPVAVQVSLESPYWFIVQDRTQLTTDTILADENDAAFLLASAGRVANEINAGLFVDSGGGYVDSGILDFAPYGYLAEDIGYLDDTIYVVLPKDFSAISTGNDTLALIGDEIVNVAAVGEDSNGTFLTVGRGCLDTVPHKHTVTSNGPPIIFIQGFTDTDGIQYTASDVVNVKLRTVLASNILPLSSAVAVPVTMDSRAIRPYPPGRLAVDSVLYPDAAVFDGTNVITWAHRDRTQQTSTFILDATDTSVGPEAGTTYRIVGVATLPDTTTVEFINQNVGAVTSFDFATDPDSSYITPPGNAVSVQLKVYSERGGYQSLQAATVEMGFEFDSNFVPTDPFFADVLVLAYFDDGAGNPIFDEVLGASKWALAGSAEITAAQSRFGTSSLVVPTGANAATLANSEYSAFGAGDFTFEISYRPTGSAPASSRIWQDRNGDVVPGLYLAHQTGTTIQIGLDANGTGFDVLQTIGTSLTANTWVDLCVERHGSTVRVYFNETVVYTNSSYSSALYFDAAGTSIVGGQVSGSRGSGGHFQNLRITKGVARYQGTRPPIVDFFPAS